MKLIFELTLLKYNYKLHYIKKLRSVNVVPYGALLISRLNDLRDSAYLHCSLIRKAIPQCGAAITKTCFEIICAWQSNIIFSLFSESLKL